MQRLWRGAWRQKVERYAAPALRKRNENVVRRPGVRDNETDLARNMRSAAHARPFGRVSNTEEYKEPILPSLQETRAVVTLAPAKSSGLADLGAPLDDATVVKKGRVHEYLQHLTEGAIGRRFQDIRIIGIKTVEAGVVSAKFFVQFEVFGDNTAAPANGVGFEAALFAGERPLASLSSSSLFLPYANFWYPNRFVFDVSIDDFDQADRLEFIAKAEDVRAV
jgi:hypothetical protein